jgi:cytochrome c556
MMKCWAALSVGLLAMMLAAGVGADEPKAEDQASFWMKKKLDYSEHILEGLAKEDYGAIAKNARSMNALSHFERWVRSSLPEYRAQLRIFENANQQLIRSADAEQLDGAALAYVQLTLSCVNCHKVVRDSSTEKTPRKP